MFEFDLLNLGLTIVNLLFLFAILRWLFWKPVSEFLDKRRQMVNDDLDNAKRDREEAEILLAEHRQLIAENKETAAKVIDEAIRQADLRKEEIIAAAGREAAALLQRAKGEIDLERAKVVEELRADISGLAVAVAEKTLARALTPQDRSAFLAAALKELDSYAN